MANQVPYRDRRTFLKGLGGTLVGSAALPTLSAAQTSRQAGSTLKVIDFHNHFLGDAFNPIVGGTNPPAVRRAYFDAVNRNLASSQALLDSVETAGVAARVINTPIE